MVSSHGDSGAIARILSQLGPFIDAKFSQFKKSAQTPTFNRHVNPASRTLTTRGSADFMWLGGGSSGVLRVHFVKVQCQFYKTIIYTIIKSIPQLFFFRTQPRQPNQKNYHHYITNINQ